MEITDAVDVRTRAAWRRWLSKHHATKKEIWLVYHKKASGVARVAYDDAVEEAICFGWIDGLVKSIDADRYAQRFTPRKPGSIWSKLNVERARRMVEAGLMTRAGLATIDPEIVAGTSPRIVDRDPAEACAFLEKALAGHSRALESYRNLAPSYRKQYALWVASAKREETRQRRLDEAIGRLERNEKLFLK